MSQASTLRCSIYTRKSSEEGLEQAFNSLDAQREACEAYIKSQAGEGWEVLETPYDDGGFSGGTMERPALTRLLSDIKDEKIDIVVVYKVDRLTRSLTDFAKIVDIFEAQSVSFVSVTQAFNTTTSMGRLTLNVLLSFAQFEREVTSERIRDKFAASKKKGMWMGGNPPLGYDVQDRKLIVNEEEAGRVKLIYENYIKLRSVRALAEFLRQRKIHSKSWTTQKGMKKGGAPFSRGALYALLKNPVYLGQVIHKGKAYPGEHEAILKRVLWDEGQALLTANRRKQEKTKSSVGKSFLKGCLFDDQGNPMTPSYTKKRNGARYRYYVSSALIKGAPQEAGSIPRVPAHEVEALVSERVKAFYMKATRNGWEEMSPSDHEKWIRKIIQKVVIRKNEVELTLIRSFHGDDQDFESEIFRHGKENGETAILRIPVRLKNRGGEKIISGPDGAGDHLRSRSDRALIKAISRAHSWREELETGKVKSVNDLAQKAKCSKRYINRIIKLAFLAPDITYAILQEAQPPHLTLARLLEMDLPLSWAKQRQKLGVYQRQSA